MSERKKILILGGGLGGLYAAIGLERTIARDPDVEVTLVNRENFFLFTPMLHEVAASDLDLSNIVNPVRKLLRRVNFYAGDVEAIDLANRQVKVSHGFDQHHHVIDYDYLVIARFHYQLFQLAGTGAARAHHEVAGRCHLSAQSLDCSSGRS
jgi:NADH dehydrogenase